MCLTHHGYMIHQIKKLDIASLEKDHDAVHHYIRSLDKQQLIRWEERKKHGPAAPSTQVSSYTVPETGVVYDVQRKPDNRKLGSPCQRIYKIINVSKTLF